MEILEATLFLALLAGLLSLILVVVSRKFAVQENPLTAAVDDILPQYNCGACGFPGCAGFARHMAENRDPDGLCIPGGPELAKQIAGLLGMEVKKTVPVVAHVFCRGSNSRAVNNGLYLGLKDCVAADLVNAAVKVCPAGCLGYGSCVDACAFDAITIIDGIATILEDKCIACGKCIDACPRHLIRLVPKGGKVCVECHTQDRGGPVKKYCQVGCTTCQLCVKKCPEEAISLQDSRITIDFEKCTLCMTCVEVCPQHTIEAVAMGDAPSQNAEVQL
jgi:Na+-translocating ferredoxin:NAD+ oxidoreductase subunit B